MGNYISQSDVEGRWGTSNVAAWSQLSNTSVTADTARIDLAIAWAELTIDDRFRGAGYVVPLTPVTAVVKEWAAALAGIWLYRARRITDRTGTDTADTVEASGLSAEQEMSMYLSGTRKGAWAKSHTCGTAPWVMS